MGPDVKLPSIDMYSPTNSSAVNKKQHKNLARSLVSYKGPDIIAMILSITILSISNIPTYYTQHRAYSRERAKLIKKMENYTILTALMNSFKARYPGYCVIAINDQNHYLKFQVVKDEPPDSIGMIPPSTPDTARVDSASASSSSTSATAASTYPPLQPIGTNPNLIPEPPSSNPNAPTPRMPTRDSDGRFVSGVPVSPNPFAATDSDDGEGEEKESADRTQPKSVLPVSPTAPTQPGTAVDSTDLTYEQKLQIRRQAENSEAGGRMLMQWLGDHHGQRNHLLLDVEEKGLDPLTHPIETLIWLDIQLLSGTHHTLKEEDDLERTFESQQLLLTERLADYWYINDKNHANLSLVTNEAPTAKRRYRKFHSQLTKLRDEQIRQNKPDPFKHMWKVLDEVHDDYTEKYAQSLTDDQLREFIARMTKKEKQTNIVPDVNANSNRRSLTQHQLLHLSEQTSMSEQQIVSMQDQDPQTQLDTLMLNLLSNSPTPYPHANRRVQFQSTASSNQPARLESYVANSNANPSPNDYRATRASPYRQNNSNNSGRNNNRGLGRGAGRQSSFGNNNSRPPLSNLRSDRRNTPPTGNQRPGNIRHDKRPNVGTCHVRIEREIGGRKMITGCTCDNKTGKDSGCTGAKNSPNRRRDREPGANVRMLSLSSSAIFPSNSHNNNDHKLGSGVATACEETLMHLSESPLSEENVLHLDHMPLDVDVSPTQILLAEAEQSVFDALSDADKLALVYESSVGSDHADAILMPTDGGGGAVATELDVDLKKPFVVDLPLLRPSDMTTPGEVTLDKVTLDEVLTVGDCQTLTMQVATDPLTLLGRQGEKRGHSSCKHEYPDSSLSCRGGSSKSLAQSVHGKETSVHSNSNSNPNPPDHATAYVDSDSNDSLDWTSFDEHLSADEDATVTTGPELFDLLSARFDAVNEDAAVITVPDLLSARFDAANEDAAVTTVPDLLSARFDDLHNEDASLKMKLIAETARSKSPILLRSAWPSYACADIDGPSIETTSLLGRSLPDTSTILMVGDRVTFSDHQSYTAWYSRAETSSGILDQELVDGNWLVTLKGGRTKVVNQVNINPATPTVTWREMFLFLPRTILTTMCAIFRCILLPIMKLLRAVRQPHCMGTTVATCIMLPILLACIVLLTESVFHTAPVPLLPTDSMTAYHSDLRLMALSPVTNTTPFLTMCLLGVVSGIALVTFPRQNSSRKKGKRSPPGVLHGKSKKHAEQQTAEDFARAQDIMQSQGLSWNAFKRWHDSHLDARSHLLEVYYTHQNRLKVAPFVDAHAIRNSDALDHYYEPHWQLRKLRTLVGTITQERKVLLSGKPYRPDWFLVFTDHNSVRGEIVKGLPQPVSHNDIILSAMSAEGADKLRSMTKGGAANIIKRRMNEKNIGCTNHSSPSSTNHPSRKPLMNTNNGKGNRHYGTNILNASHSAYSVVSNKRRNKHKNFNTLMFHSPALNALVSAGNENSALYLSGRGWFNRDQELQKRVLSICVAGLGAHIHGCAGDIDDEISRVEQLVRKQTKLKHFGRTPDRSMRGSPGLSQPRKSNPPTPHTHSHYQVHQHRHEHNHVHVSALETSLKELVAGVKTGMLDTIFKMHKLSGTFNKHPVPAGCCDFPGCENTSASLMEQCSIKHAIGKQYGMTEFELNEMMKALGKEEKCAFSNCDGTCSQGMDFCEGNHATPNIIARAQRRMNAIMEPRLLQERQRQQRDLLSVVPHLDLQSCATQSSSSNVVAGDESDTVATTLSFSERGSVGDGSWIAAPNLEKMKQCLDNNTASPLHCSYCLCHGFLPCDHSLMECPELDQARQVADDCIKPANVSPAKVGDKLLVTSTVKNDEYKTGVVNSVVGDSAKVSLADGTTMWVRTDTVRETATVTVNQDSLNQIYPLFTGKTSSDIPAIQVPIVDTWYALNLKSNSLPASSPILRVVQLSFKGSDGTLVCQNLILTDRRSSRFGQVPTVYDVTTVVSLNKNGGEKRPTRLDERELLLLHFKVADGDNTDTVENRKAIWQAVRAIADASILGHRVLINCKKGGSPSGLVILAFLLELMPLEQALPQLMAQAPWMNFNSTAITFLIDLENCLRTSTENAVLTATNFREIFDARVEHSSAMPDVQYVTDDWLCTSCGGIGSPNAGVQTITNGYGSVRCHHCSAQKPYHNSVSPRANRASLVYSQTLHRRSLSTPPLLQQIDAVRRSMKKMIESKVEQVFENDSKCVLTDKDGVQRWSPQIHPVAACITYGMCTAQVELWTSILNDDAESALSWSWITKMGDDPTFADMLVTAMPFCVHVLEYDLNDIEWTHDELDTLHRFKSYLVFLVQLNPRYCAALELTHGLHLWSPIGKMLQGRKMLRASASKDILNGSELCKQGTSPSTVCFPQRAVCPPTHPPMDSTNGATDELLRGENSVCFQTTNEPNNSSPDGNSLAEPKGPVRIVASRKYCEDKRHQQYRDQATSEEECNSDADTVSVGEDTDNEEKSELPDDNDVHELRVAINRAASGEPHPDIEESLLETGEMQQTAPPGHFKTVLLSSEANTDIPRTPTSTPTPVPASPVSTIATNVGTVLRGVVAANLPSLSEACQLPKFTNCFTTALEFHLLVVCIILILASVIVYCCLRRYQSSASNALPTIDIQSSIANNEAQDTDKSERVMVEFTRCSVTANGDARMFHIAPIEKSLYVPPPKFCTHCQVGLSRGGETTCKGCKTAHFCDNECQRQGWPNHKRNCMRNENTAVVDIVKHQLQTVKSTCDYVSSSDMLTDDQRQTAIIGLKELCILAQSDYERRTTLLKGVETLTSIHKLNVTVINGKDIRHYNLLRQQESSGSTRRTALINSMMDTHPDRVIIVLANGNIGVWYQHRVHVDSGVVSIVKLDVAVFCGRPVILQDTALEHQMKKSVVIITNRIADDGFNPMISPCQYCYTHGYEDCHSLTTCPEIMTMLKPPLRCTTDISDLSEVLSTEGAGSETQYDFEREKYNFETGDRERMVNVPIRWVRMLIMGLLHGHIPVGESAIPPAEERLYSSSWNAQMDQCPLPFSLGKVESKFNTSSITHMTTTRHVSSYNLITGQRTTFMSGKHHLKPCQQPCCEPTEEWILPLLPTRKLRKSLYGNIPALTLLSLEDLATLDVPLFTTAITPWMKPRWGYYPNRRNEREVTARSTTVWSTLLTLHNYSCLAANVCQSQAWITGCGVVMLIALGYQSLVNLKHKQRNMSMMALARSIIAVFIICTLVVYHNPPWTSSADDLFGTTHIDLTAHECNLAAPHHINLNVDPLGPWAMLARSKLPLESFNLNFSSPQHNTDATTSEERKKHFPLNNPSIAMAILDSGASSSGVNQEGRLSGTYNATSIIGGALGKYSVCKKRGTCNFMAYDRQNNKFATVPMQHTCLIPDLQQDLFSVAELAKSGLYFSNESLILHTETTKGKHASEVPFVEYNGLYRLPILYSDAPPPNASQTAEWRAWGQMSNQQRTERMNHFSVSRDKSISPHLPITSLWYPTANDVITSVTTAHATVVAPNLRALCPSSTVTKVIGSSLGDILADSTRKDSFLRDHIDVEVVYSSPPMDSFKSSGAMLGTKTKDGMEIVNTVKLLTELPSLKLAVIEVDPSLPTHFPETCKQLLSIAESAKLKTFSKSLISSAYGSGEYHKRHFFILQSTDSRETVGDFNFPPPVGGQVTFVPTADRGTVTELAVHLRRKKFPTTPAEISSGKPVALGEVQTRDGTTAGRYYSMDYPMKDVSETANSPLYLDKRHDLIRPIILDERLCVRGYNRSLLEENGLVPRDMQDLLESSADPQLRTLMLQQAVHFASGAKGNRTFVSDDNLNWTAEQAHVRCMHCWGTTAALLGFSPLKHKCEACALATIKKKPYSRLRIPKVPKRAYKFGIDILPMSVPSRSSGYTSLLVAICYHTHRIFIHPMKAKSDAPEALRSLLDQIKVDLEPHEIAMSRLRGDSDPNFFDTAFQKVCNDEDFPIRFSASAPGDQWQNGLVEITNGLLKDKVVTCLVTANRSPDLWLAAARWCVYTHTRLPCQANLGNMSPYEAWHHTKPCISHLRGWGCDAVVKDLKHTNLTPKGRKGTFLAYSSVCSPGTYSVLMHDSGRIVQSRNVEFLEFQLYPDFTPKLTPLSTAKALDTASDIIGSDKGERWDQPLQIDPADADAHVVSSTTIVTAKAATTAVKPRYSVTTLRADDRLIIPGTRIGKIISSGITERVHKMIGLTPTQCLGISYTAPKGQIKCVTWNDVKWDLEHEYAALESSSAQTTPVSINYLPTKVNGSQHIRNRIILLDRTDVARIVSDDRVSVSSGPLVPHVNESFLSTMIGSISSMFTNKSIKDDPFPTLPPDTFTKAKVALTKALLDIEKKIPTPTQCTDSSRGLYGPSVLSGEERAQVKELFNNGSVNEVEIDIETINGLTTTFAIANDERMQLLHNTQTDLTEFMNVMTADEDIPKDLNAVLRSPERKAWMDSIRSELQSLMGMGALRVVLMRPHQRLLGTKLVLKRKFASDGKTLLKHKARLTIQGFREIENVDYHKIYSPTCSLTTMKVMACVANHYDLELENYDFETAFLQSFMAEKLFCDYPHGLRPPLSKTKNERTAAQTCSKTNLPTTVKPEDLLPSTPADWDGAPTCLQIIRSVYGTRQSPRNFNSMVHKWFVGEKKHGGSGLNLKRSSVDSCLYYREEIVGGTIHKTWNPEHDEWVLHTVGGKSHRIWILLYVDDVAVAYCKTNPITKRLRDEFRASLLKEFKVDDRGDLEHFLGYKFMRDRVNRKLKMTQTASLMKLLKESGMLTTETKMTPASPECKPSLKDKPNLDTEEGKAEAATMADKPFANRVGSLLWIARTYRPDISWIVGMLTRFMACPGLKTWQYSSYALKYLSSTKNRGLIYSHSNNGMTLRGVCDANHLSDYGNAKENRKNTIGWAFFLGNASISVRSRKAQRPSCSTAESETQALWDAIREAVWLRRMMKDFGIEQTNSTIIECDSQVAIRLTEEDCESERSKHWDGEFHCIRNEVNERESVKIQFVESGKCTADTLTKPVSRRIFDEHATRLLGREWMFDGEEILA